MAKQFCRIGPWCRSRAAEVAVDALSRNRDRSRQCWNKEGEHFRSNCCPFPVQKFRNLKTAFGVVATAAAAVLWRWPTTDAWRAVGLSRASKFWRNNTAWLRRVGVAEARLPLVPGLPLLWRRWPDTDNVNTFLLLLLNTLTALFSVTRKIAQSGHTGPIELSNILIRNIRKVLTMTIEISRQCYKRFTVINYTRHFSDHYNTATFLIYYG